MRLNVKAFALACGILWSLMMLLLTLWFVVRGLDCSFMENFSTIYIGYSVTWAGAVVGALWGFVDGLIGGVAFAWLYNKLAGVQ